MAGLRCLVLFCLGLFSIAKAQPFYIIAPNSLRVDSDEVIGIAIDGERGALVNFYIQDHPGKIKNITQKQIEVRPGFPSTFKIHLNPRDFPPSFLKDPHSENIVSLTAHCELFHKEILLPVNFNGGYVFVQTDKPIYTPRDRAHFRIIPLGEDVLPSDKPFVLQIKNPQNVVVEETTFNKKPGTAFVSHKYNFPTYAINGEWSATVKYGHELGENTTVRFILREYVLPTFTVELKTQDVILETAEFITVSVNAKYVYGKKVKGLVTFRFGVQGETPEAVMFGLIGPEQLDEGSHILRLPTSEIKQHKDIGWFPEIEGSHLIVEATVVDDATGKKEKAYSSKAIFSKSPFVISFKRSLIDFKPGLVSILEANVNFVDGKPASGILTKITAKVNNEVLKIKHNTAVSDGEGKVSFKLQPEMHHEKVSITVETIDPKYNGSQAVGYHEQYKFKSNNNAYLALERSSGQKLKPGDGFLKLVHIHPPEISDIYYVVVSKGQIIFMNKLPRGRFLLHKVEFDITYDMVPSFRLIVFAHYNDELIADSLQIDVQHVCHPEAEVTINPEFDDQSPGAAGKIIIRGQRDTLVGLLGVDEAVYAISKRNLLTKAKVFNTFNKHDLGCGAGGGLNTDSVLNNAGVVLATNKYSPSQDRSSSCVEKKRRKRDIGSDILSSYTGLEKECCALGMSHDPHGRSCEARTNIVVRYLKGEHKNCSRAFLGCCLEAMERGFTEMKVDEPRGRSGRPLVPEIDFIPINEEHIFEKDLFLRTDFKEVWIFQDVTISAGNKQELSLSLPHSITTWVIQAVSVSQTHGICVAEPKKVLSFKKIFLQLDLPYSVVRNEQVEIPATIFNYGHKRLSAIMYMYGVEHLCTGTKKDEKSERKRLIVEGQSAVTATFPVIPLKEGEFDIRVVALSAEGSDAVMRKLHVVPEGYPDGIDFSIKLDPSNMQRRKRRFVSNNRYSDSVDESQNLQVTAIKLHVPQDFVPGTESCVITALGDQLGPAVETTINNPDKLLTKPRGCGEQNMMFLAPTLYTMRYLKVKGKITPEIEEKGYGYIRQGYGNELAFRKEDGSYAAYQHKPTSTWLTAFVMKVFCQANELIHIDENVLCTGVKWLIDNQQPDGSYIESHPMYHLDMMGGVQGKTPMTAFALIALEECKCDAENLHLAKKRAVAFLEQHLGEVNEALPVAIVAYALALGESDLKEAAHDKLLSLATHDEDANMIYWDTGNPARNIEATAYGLLNLLLFNDMMRSASIVNWLNSQQLQSGSFQSTQDTVIALQALAEYAIRAQMPPINLVSNITSSNDRNFHKVLSFNEGNAMVLQDVEVKKIGGTLFINTAGHGVGSLSVKLRYNVNRPPEQICKFDVTVNVTEATGEAKEADLFDPQLVKLDPSRNDVFNLLEADLIRGMGQALDKEEDIEPVFVGDPRNRQPASLVAAAPEKEIRVKRENAAENSKLIYKISICARYLGDKTAEMSIVDVGLFSGFEAEERDLELLQNSADGMIQRYEKSKRGIVFYLQTIPRDKKYCFSFHVTRQFIVGGTQASVIKVYDYYTPGYSCTVFYSPASNSPLLHTICEGGICQCAEGGCPPKEPFEEIRKIRLLSDRREKLLDTACENYHYVWKGKVLENAKKAGIFLNITFFIEKVIKEGTEKAELIEGETRTLLLRDSCASSEPFPNAEYLIMGKDGQKYKDDNDQIWHRYMLDKNSIIYLWTSIDKAQFPDLQRDLNHVARKLKKTGCNE